MHVSCLPGCRLVCHAEVAALQKGVARQVVQSATWLLHRRRSDSCVKCRGPSGENLSQGYYEAGGSFLKLGLVESFLVRRRRCPTLQWNE